MKSIRIGNDIRIEWPIVLSGDVSKLQDLDLTVEVRPSAKIIDTHNYADEIRNNDNKRLLFEKHETTVMMNGGLECRRDIGDGKEHCRPRPPRPCPPRPIPPAPVKLPYHIEDNTLIAMWTADRQFATGDYDIILYAHKNEGGQAVCDQYRFVRLVSHTAQADAPDDSGIEAVIAMQPVTLELSGLSAYEVAVINGFQGTEEEWLASLKKPAEDAAEELKQEIEQFKEDTKEELQADIKALGYYEDNPEFIRAYTDADGKFLWGIRIDGSIEWAKGVPTPIQNALKELADKIRDLGGDKIEEVETALNEKIEALQDAIDVINASLKTLTDTFSYQDNPEFVNVVTDAEGKVLFGIKEDGKPYFPKNEMYSVESNQEFLAAWLDAAGHVLFGLRTDGSTYVAKADFLTKIEEIRQLLEDNGIGDDELKQRVDALEDTFQHQENKEFAYVITDSERKVLFGIKADGSPFFPNNEMYHVIQNEEYLAAWVDANNKILFGIKTDGSTYIAKSEYINAVKEIQAKIESLSESVQSLTETFTIISNDEWLHAIVDAEGKLLFGIKAENGEVVMSKQDTYKVVSNDEWLAAWLDATNKILFGVKADGTFWAAKSNFSGGGNYDEQIAEINETLQQVQDQLKDIDTSGVANTVFSVIDDAEERLSVTTDKDERVISYRDKDGVLHEKKGIDTSKYYLNGEEKKFVDNLTDLEGVSDHNTPNLLVASEMQKTFNDGTNSFTPPNEGYEMSNPIECQAGDWFTRTGTATGMVVVTDEDDKNGARLFNADGTTLGNTFQIPRDMTWVRYIRMAAEVVGAESGSVVICKGKNAFIGDNRGDFLTIDKLRLQNANIPKDIKYLKSSDGKYWELYVDDSHTLQIREIDPNIITDLPADFPIYNISGNFGETFDTWISCTPPYLIERNANGVINFYKATNDVVGYGEFKKVLNSGGLVRYARAYEYGVYLGPQGENQLTIYDEDFNVVDTGIGGISGYVDSHDFVYFDDNHVAVFRAINKEGSITIPYGDNSNKQFTGMLRYFSISELKKTNGEWSKIGEFNMLNYPRLFTDIFGSMSENSTLEVHPNTLFIDYDGNYVVNLRNNDSFIKIRRKEETDGSVTIGSKTYNYDEAIIGRVGGKYNAGYIDSKRVLEEGFTFTDVPTTLTDRSTDEQPEWKWYHAHDVSYWGKKLISGVQYPTYLLFDNNMWTNNNETTNYIDINPRNNYQNNPTANNESAFVDNKSDSGGAYDTHMVSRVVQLSIDWENHLIKDYRIYVIPKKYSYTRSGAQMLEEGVLLINWTDAHECGLYDFNDEQTQVQNHTYTNGKELWHVANHNSYRVHCMNNIN